MFFWDFLGFLSSFVDCFKTLPFHVMLKLKRTIFLLRKIILQLLFSRLRSCKFCHPRSCRCFCLWSCRSLFSVLELTKLGHDSIPSFPSFTQRWWSFQVKWSSFLVVHQVVSVLFRAKGAHKIHVTCWKKDGTLHHIWGNINEVLFLWRMVQFGWTKFDLRVFGVLICMRIYCNCRNAAWNLLCRTSSIITAAASKVNSQNQTCKTTTSESTWEWTLGSANFIHFFMRMQIEGVGPTVSESGDVRERLFFLLSIFNRSIFCIVPWIHPHWSSMWWLW